MGIENWGDIPCKRNPRLILFGVVGFDSLDLDDDCSIALREGFTLGGDSAGNVARGESACNGDGGGDGHD